MRSTIVSTKDFPAHLSASIENIIANRASTEEVKSITQDLIQNTVISDDSISNHLLKMAIQNISPQFGEFLKQLRAHRGSIVRKWFELSQVTVAGTHKELVAQAGFYSAYLAKNPDQKAANVVSRNDPSSNQKKLNLIYAVFNYLLKSTEAANDFTLSAKDLLGVELPAKVYSCPTAGIEPLLRKLLIHGLEASLDKPTKRFFLENFAEFAEKFLSNHLRSHGCQELQAHIAIAQILQLVLPNILNLINKEDLKNGAIPPMIRRFFIESILALKKLTTKSSFKTAKKSQQSYILYMLGALTLDLRYLSSYCSITEALDFLRVSGDLKAIFSAHAEFALFQFYSSKNESDSIFGLSSDERARLAFSHLNRAVELGHPEANYRMAQEICYDRVPCLSASLSRREKIIRELPFLNFAASKGHCGANRAIGVFYLRDQMPDMPVDMPMIERIKLALPYLKLGQYGEDKIINLENMLANRDSEEVKQKINEVESQPELKKHKAEIDALKNTIATLNKQLDELTVQRINLESNLYNASLWGNLGAANPAAQDEVTFTQAIERESDFDLDRLGALAVVKSEPDAAVDNVNAEGKRPNPSTFFKPQQHEDNQENKQSKFPKI